MAKKTHYESGNMFMKADKRLTKKENYEIESLGDNKISATLSWDMVFLAGRKSNIEKDVANKKNVLKLVIWNLTPNLSKSNFLEQNRKEITDIVRISRQYSKDNKLSLYIDSGIPEKDFVNCALDKETNTVYPILLDELKEFAKHNVPVTFQPRNFTDNRFHLPDKLNAEIDLSHNDDKINMSMEDENGHISYNMSNVKFTSAESKKLVILDKSYHDNEIEDNSYPAHIISLPKHERNFQYDYKLFSRKPFVLGDNNVDKRNVKITYFPRGESSKEFLVLLSEFYKNPENLTKDERETLKNVFVHMKENGLDIIKQSKLLLNGTVEANLKNVGKRYYYDRKPLFNIQLSDRVFEDREKIEQNIKKIINDDKIYEVIF